MIAWAGPGCPSPRALPRSGCCPAVKAGREKRIYCGAKNQHQHFGIASRAVWAAASAAASAAAFRCVNAI